LAEVPARESLGGAALQQSDAQEASPLWHYVVVRRELTGGALLAQVVHAAEMTGSFHGVNHGKSMPSDSRCVVLVATKEQLQQIVDSTANRSDVQLSVVTETDGPLAGSTTAVAFLAESREQAKPLVGHLRPWRAQ
jgi:hypothetical protein